MRLDNQLCTSTIKRCTSILCDLVRDLRELNIKQKFIMRKESRGGRREREGEREGSVRTWEVEEF